jgi:hypothetical protein
MKLSLDGGMQSRPKPAGVCLRTILTIFSMSGWHFRAIGGSYISLGAPDATRPNVSATYSKHVTSRGAGARS